MAGRDLEERVARLEEEAFFEAEKVRKLDVQLLAQQTQLDNLAKQVEGLRSMARQLRDLGDTIAERAALEEEIPPHYQSTDWRHS